MNKPNGYERLDKFLSNVGIASRRQIKHILKTEIISVNGRRVTSPGEHIDPKKDKIEHNGKTLRRRGFLYYILNKPKGIISTTDDEYERDNVVSLIDERERIYPIGRLDKETTGLILLTNDGPLTQRLTHPKFHVPKVYRLLIAGNVDEKQLKALREGVLLSDGITSPADVRVIKTEKHTTILEVVLHEGRNRQIRRMCETVGIELQELERIKFGSVTLKGLQTGEYRLLTKDEIDSLKKAAGLSGAETT